MINSLDLINFKGVRKGHLNLYPLTILVGANNSAKSTVLESLFLAANPFRWFLRDTAYRFISQSHLLLLDSDGASLLFNGYNAREASVITDGREL